MSKQEETLDYCSDHYWVVGRPGRDDYELQSRDGDALVVHGHRVIFG
jgi:hypothetical protein